MVAGADLGVPAALAAARAVLSPRRATADEDEEVN
jgi:hypothetical protein